MVKMNRIFGLDLMRFIAISFVLVGHGWFLLGDMGLIAHYIKGIFVFGVEIFFVLSGFLIGGILLRDFEKSFTPHDVLHFWKRRWFRTMPNYLLFLLINYIGFSFLSSNFSWNWQYLFFLQNFAWMPDGFFSVSWSLAIEEWFYLIIPLAIYSLKFLPLKLATLLVIIAIISFCTIMRLYGSIYQGYAWNEELRLVTIYRLDSLMYGVFAAWLNHYKKTLFTSCTKQTFIVAIVCICTAIYFRNSSLIESNAVISAIFFPLSCIGFMFLLPTLSTWRINSNNIITKSITSISTWAYSLYLIHVPLLEVVKIFANKFPTVYSFPFNLLVFFSWLLTSIFLSFMIYKFFEKPMMNLRDKTWFSEATNKLQISTTKDQ